MAVYNITVPDEQEQCITAAREAYNQSIPPIVPGDAPGDPPHANPDLKPDNAAYMDWVMLNAVASYCAMYFPQGPERTALDSLVAENAIPLTPRNQELIDAILRN